MPTMENSDQSPISSIANIILFATKLLTSIFSKFLHLFQQSNNPASNKYDFFSIPTIQFLPHPIFSIPAIQLRINSTISNSLKPDFFSLSLQFHLHSSTPFNTSALIYVLPGPNSSKPPSSNLSLQFQLHSSISFSIPAIQLRITLTNL